MLLRVLGFTIILLLLSQKGNTQELAIGTDTPNPNAILDLQTNNKGVLIPRLTTAERTTMTASLGASELGLLIFNTTTSEFNYWNGSVWISFPSSTSDHDWYEEGTSTGPDNINDNIFTHGSVGIGEANPQRELHVAGAIRVDGNAIYNNEASSGPNLNLISTGGVSVILDANTNGSEEFTVKSGSTTAQNVFEVSEGGNTQMDGDLTISGNDLEFDGATNPVDIFTNSSNTSMGLDIESQGGIDLVLDRDNNNASSDFTIKRNNDGTAAVNTLFTVPEDFSPLVYPYGTSNGETGGIRFRELASNGTSYLGIRAPNNIGSSFQLTLPTNAGANGEVLTTDGTGVLSWSSGGSSGAALQLSNSSNITLTNNSQFTFRFNTVDYNLGGGSYNNATGEYTVNEAGVYSIYANLNGNFNAAASKDMYIIYRVYVNNSLRDQTVSQGGATVSFNNANTFHFANHVNVAAGDVIAIQAICSWAPTTPDPFFIGGLNYAGSKITIIKSY